MNYNDERQEHNTRMMIDMSDVKVMMDRHQSPIVTGTYAGWHHTQGIPVRTTVGVPRDWPQRNPQTPLEDGSKLAPWGLLKVSEQVFRQKYPARLDKVGVAGFEAIRAIFERYGGTEPVVLLCYCKITHLNGYCHRRVLADWIQARTGLHVPDMMVRQPAKPTAPPEASLF